jgi:hypothetical protein
MEESLKDICKENNIFWTDNPKVLEDWLNFQIDIGILKEQRIKDL